MQSITVKLNAQPPLALEVQFRLEATVMHLFCAHTDVQAFNKSPLRQLYSILSRALRQLPMPCPFFVSSHNELHLVRLHCRAACHSSHYCSAELERSLANLTSADIVVFEDQPTFASFRAG